MEVASLIKWGKIVNFNRNLANMGKIWKKLLIDC